MNKNTLLVGFFLMLLIVPVMASDFNCTIPDSNISFGTIGNCIVGSTFGSWPVFAALITLMIAFSLWKAGAGKSTVLPIAIITSFALATINSQVFLPLFTISIILVGAIAVILVMVYAKQ